MRRLGRDERVDRQPLIGRMTDAVTQAGGSAILTEIPEMFGAETLLLERTTSPEVFGKLSTLVNRFKRYFLDHGEPVSENPSPGNIAGGITTLEEKSLGAVQKGGQAPVCDVIDYGGQITTSGLTVLEAPGNDAVSTTALAAAGATITLFSTGRGTPLGSPVPTVKIASNAALAAHKPGWIDFDAGTVLAIGMEAAAQDLLTHSGHCQRRTGLQRAQRGTRHRHLEARRHALRARPKSPSGRALRV
jgi:altronate hydrolase